MSSAIDVMATYRLDSTASTAYNLSCFALPPIIYSFNHGIYVGLLHRYLYPRHYASRCREVLQPSHSQSDTIYNSHHQTNTSYVANTGYEIAISGYNMI
jgi:hypothetical protein